MIWTEQRKLQLRDLLAQPELSLNKIAQMFGITKNAVIGAKNRYTTDRRPSPIKAKLSDDTKRAIVAAAAEGKQPAAIGIAFGVQPSTIVSILARLPPPEKTLPALPSLAQDLPASPRPPVVMVTAPAPVAKPAAPGNVRAIFPRSSDCLWVDGDRPNFRLCTAPRVRGCFCDQQARLGFASAALQASA